MHYRWDSRLSQAGDDRGSPQMARPFLKTTRTLVIGVRCRHGDPRLACLDAADFGYTNCALNGLHANHFTEFKEIISHEMAET